MQDLSNNVGGGGEADAFIGHLGHNGDEARVCTRRISMSTFITALSGDPISLAFPHLLDTLVL